MPSQREDPVQSETPEKAAMAGAVAVVGGNAQLRAFDGLAAACALDRGRVDQQQLILGSRAATGKHTDHPLDRLGEGSSARVVPRLAGSMEKQMSELAAGHRQKAPIRWDAHDRLCDAQGDHLGVNDLSACVGPSGRQELIGCAINGNAESVEVGVHRGLRVDGAFLSTADFDLSVLNPFATGIPVKSII
jgi:hypothetical protein